MLPHHVGHQLLARCGGVAAALGRKICPGLLHYMQAQAERGFVQYRQRPDRHAALNAGVFYHRSRDAFAQHGRTLHDKGAEHPAGEEAA